MTSDSNSQNGNGLKDLDWHTLRIKAGFRSQQAVADALPPEVDRKQQTISLVERGGISASSNTAKAMLALFNERIERQRAKTEASLKAADEIVRRRAMATQRFFTQQYPQSNQIVRKITQDPMSREVIVTIQAPDGTEISWIEDKGEADAWMNFHKSVKTQASS
jgi:DNA-binding XRE family transcriptional regulator